MSDHPAHDPEYDAVLEAQLAQTRARRAAAARFMVWLLVVPLAAQTAWVLFGIAAVFGLTAVVVPAVVVWIVVRGRRAR